MCCKYLCLCYAEERKYVVKDETKEIFQLNELEYVHDELWANVWMVIYLLVLLKTIAQKFDKISM